MSKIEGCHHPEACRKSQTSDARYHARHHGSKLCNPCQRENTRAHWAAVRKAKLAAVHRPHCLNEADCKATGVKGAIHCRTCATIAKNKSPEFAEMQRRIMAEHPERWLMNKPEVRERLNDPDVNTRRAERRRAACKLYLIMLGVPVYRIEECRRISRSGRMPIAEVAKMIADEEMIKLRRRVAADDGARERIEQQRDQERAIFEV